MRLQSAATVSVRDKVIGGPAILVCMPLTDAKRPDLIHHATELMRLDPDILEWRIDGYDRVDNVSDSLQALKELREAIGNTPLIFTCRIDTEGGFRKISAAFRLQLLLAAIESGVPDIVDVEMCNDAAFMDAVKKAASRFGTRLILSYHNFDTTPDEVFLVDKLVQAQGMGAHIAKVAAMPQNRNDVLIMLGATLKARSGPLKIPAITVSMGAQGLVTRLAGGMFGSDVTFAAGKHMSAPGQIPIDDLRQAMKVLYDT